jgi:single-strand DNA-binding protein
MLNKVFLIGRLGQNPDLRYTQSGTPIATLNVATNETYTDRDGNRQDRTEWHRVMVFQRQAETCNSHLAKGSLVSIEGNLQTRKWQDQNTGQDRYITEIRAQRVIFLDRRSERPGGEDYGQGRPGPGPRPGGPGGPGGPAPRPGNRQYGDDYAPHQRAGTYGQGQQDGYGQQDPYAPPAQDAFDAPGAGDSPSNDVFPSEAAKGTEGEPESANSSAMDQLPF